MHKANSKANKGDQSVLTVSTSAELTYVTASTSSQGSMMQWDSTMNVQNDQVSREGEDALPRIQPSFCLNSNQPSLPGSDESKVAKSLPSSLSQQPREKKISFAVKQKRNYETASIGSGDAMDVDISRNDRMTNLLSQMKVLEDKIQKAACAELRYLQSLDEVTQKRTRWEEKHREAISRRPRAVDEESSSVLENYIAEADAKIAKATLVETAYKRKVKELHDKRYRWSKLHENAGRELLELDPSRKIPSLPPLLAPSFLRR
ncbi:hypothetical protein FisN_11Hh333 [Fistulifera solaris]|jgi:hypothetical protein|uniref:Uncharacterized protein n=1 Tax=Fistulifera solaris TaxID=1519565 RepID=A0A1Z5K9B2_FISSO|nr:hypothetical protein FisN_11Hh333 [Fistulifera solaris]|eukprot:GAX22776.1 hypothetical protein FisN_11Hh333 [Fistulifera solaris]